MAIELSEDEGLRSSSALPSELYGLDLTGTSHWREELSAKDGKPGLRGGIDLHHLSVDGFASPMGFRFCVSASPDKPVNGGLKITRHDRSNRSAIALAESRHRSRSTLVRTVSMPARNPRHGELTLVIGPEGADIFASEPAWEALAEPVLLVVAQYARYSSIEQQLVAMQDQARDDHRRVTIAGLRALRKHKRLIRAARDAHDLVSDWTCFSGPVADPCRSCSSERSLEAYTDLAETLEIDEWAEGIEEVASNIEQIYAAISDRLFHYRLFLWGMALELVIASMLFGLFYAELVVLAS